LSPLRHNELESRYLDFYELIDAARLALSTFKIGTAYFICVVELCEFLKGVAACTASSPFLAKD
jgi:hypothetical protein